MPIKQCICPECGVIAEVRRQSNGKKLRYLYCPNGHGGLTTRAKNDHWAAIEQDFIGELGALPQTYKDVVSPAPVVAEKVSADWVPDLADLPEVVEQEAKPVAKNVEDDEPEESDNFVKYGLIFLAALGFGGAALVAVRKR